MSEGDKKKDTGGVKTLGDEKGGNEPGTITIRGIRIASKKEEDKE